jgi:hypothetical protein
MRAVAARKCEVAAASTEARVGITDFAAAFALSFADVSPTAAPGTARDARANAMTMSAQFLDVRITAS